jgi:sugar phosphate isomerase/epimerase
MTIQLSAGSIGVKADQWQIIDYAKQFGFDVVDAYGGPIAAMTQADREKLVATLAEKKVGWGTSGLTVEFRKGDEEFNASLKALPGIAAALKQVGVKRVGTWITPTSDSVTFLENLKTHARRLREAAAVLGDHGLRLGLEYVGPKTSWSTRRYPFVHTMKEMKELIAEIGRPNVGILMDSWHWYTAGETVADLKTLTNNDVVSVDLNDAPAGLSLDQQKDSSRELPLATGVIDLAGFLNALNAFGCDAPVRCEPFNAPLRAMPPEQALKTTIDAMRKAFALIRS